MLDQDTARALLTVADEPTLGSLWSATGTNCPPSAAAECSTSPPAGRTRSPPELDAVHRFTRAVMTPDGITLAWRTRTTRG